MKIFALLFTLLSFSAQAQFLKELCQKSPFGIKYHDSLIANGKTIWNAEGKVLFAAEEKFLDYAPIEGGFWLLKKDVIQLLSSTGEVTEEITLPELSVMGWGKNFILSGEEIYIVRDTGLSRFDKSTRSFVWSTKLAESGSAAVSGTTDGTLLYVIYAAEMEGGFIGMSMLNKEGVEVKKLGLNVYRSGVFAQDAVIHWFEDRLIVNNAGWMISFDQKQLQGKKPLVSKLIPAYTQLPEGRKQVTMRGDFMLQGKEASGCGSYSHLVGGLGKIENDLFTFSL